MLFKVIDAKNNELVRFEVEMTKNMCTVAPVILDQKFNKYDNKFRNIRKEALQMYCALEGNLKQDKYIKRIENDVCDEVELCLTGLVKEYLGQGYKVFLVTKKQ